MTIDEATKKLEQTIVEKIQNIDTDKLLQNIVDKTVKDIAVLSDVVLGLDRNYSNRYPYLVSGGILETQIKEAACKAVDTKFLEALELEINRKLDLKTITKLINQKTNACVEDAIRRNLNSYSSEASKKIDQLVTDIVLNSIKTIRTQYNLGE